MTMMALFNKIQSLRLVGHLLLALFLHSFTVSAITSLAFYPDDSCKGTSINTTVSLIAHDGLCGHPNVTGKSLAATVSGESLEYDCTVSVYSDPDCSNDALAASVKGTCTKFPYTFESYSVDCISLSGSTSLVEGSNGSGTGGSNTDSKTSTPSPEATLERAQANSVGSTTSTTPLLPSGAATSSSAQDSVQPTSTSLTTKVSTSSPIPTTENSFLMNAASTPADATTRSSQAPSSTPTSTSTSSNSDSNTNLSRDGEIAIGVVIPSVAIIVTILIAIDQRRRIANVLNISQEPQRTDERPPSDAPSGAESTTNRPMTETDTETANQDP